MSYAPEAGLRRGRECSRAYAYCTPAGTGYLIGVAPKMDEANLGRVRGVLCHEFGHAVLLHMGDEDHTERDADACAEYVFGVRIYYDGQDVQTCDPRARGARHPRPRYLDDEDGFTRH